jgi:hypothetical protein
VKNHPGPSESQRFEEMSMQTSNYFYCLEREKLGEYSGLIEAFKAIQHRLS